MVLRSLKIITDPVTDFEEEQYESVKKKFFVRRCKSRSGSFIVLRSLKIITDPVTDFEEEQFERLKKLVKNCMCEDVNRSQVVLRFCEV